MDDVMQDNVEELSGHIVGHRIVSAEQYGDTFTLTLDSGRVVKLIDSSDCCAYTGLNSFLLDPNSVDHIITGVSTENDYSTWHVFADMGDVLKLDVGWSEGSGYYGYGFYINVKDAE